MAFQEGDIVCLKEINDQSHIEMDNFNVSRIVIQGLMDGNAFEVLQISDYSILLHHEAGYVPKHLLRLAHPTAIDVVISESEVF